MRETNPTLRRYSTILPSCLSYLSSRPIQASRLSHEAKDEELFSIAQNLSLETLVAEFTVYQVNCFPDLKIRLKLSSLQVSRNKCSFEDIRILYRGAIQMYKACTEISC